MGLKQKKPQPYGYSLAKDIRKAYCRADIKKSPLKKRAFIMTFHHYG